MEYYAISICPLFGVPLLEVYIITGFRFPVLGGLILTLSLPPPPQLPIHELRSNKRHKTDITLYPQGSLQIIIEYSSSAARDRKPALMSSGVFGVPIEVVSKSVIFLCIIIATIVYYSCTFSEVCNIRENLVNINSLGDPQMLLINRNFTKLAVLVKCIMPGDHRAQINEVPLYFS